MGGGGDTGAQVAATVHAASECGHFTAIKQTSRHHQELPAKMHKPPGITSKQPDTTRNQDNKQKVVYTEFAAICHTNCMQYPLN